VRSVSYTLGGEETWKKREIENNKHKILTGITVNFRV
jgi:hypothetical protein